MTVSVIKQTQCGQVASELERQIGAGLLAPGRKMPSTRELAKRFEVSQQVIKSALAVLEEHHLILRRSRIGVYVNPAAFTPPKKELCLLSIRHREYGIDYPGRMLSIPSSFIWRDTNLVIRSIAEQNFKSGILRYEIEKLKNTHVDCLLVHIDLSKAQVAAFKTLPFPVVFLGDCIPVECHKDGWNQIVEDTGERARAMVAAAATCHRRHVVLVAGALSHYYCRVLKQAGEKAARELGVTFRYAEFNQAAYQTREELAAKRQECVDAILRNGTPDALLLDGFDHFGLFADALRARGVAPGRDTLLVGDGEMYPGAVFLHTDYREFSTETMRLLAGLIANPATAIGHVVLSGLIKRTPLKIAAPD
jgi:DNA-binding LacI/PurR family transcriptional regulator